MFRTTAPVQAVDLGEVRGEFHPIPAVRTQPKPREDIVTTSIHTGALLSKGSFKMVVIASNPVS